VSSIIEAYLFFYEYATEYRRREPRYGAEVGGEFREREGNDGI
jgi:hypothetical protein